MPRSFLLRLKSRYFAEMKANQNKQLNQYTNYFIKYKYINYNQNKDV